MASLLLFDFSPPEPDDPAHWRSIDDPVMGGVSESQFVATDDGAAFTGTVSLAHGGGFASVRAPALDQDLDGATGIRLRVRGDGKRYWITTYLQPDDSISYRASIQPSDDWTSLSVPFADLEPYRRGTKVPDAPSFDPAHLHTLGFLIADGQAGPFRLETQWIRAEGTKP